MQLRQILKELGKTPQGKAKILDVLKRRRNKLGDNCFWMLLYAYYDKLSRENICKKFVLSLSDYHNKINRALDKLDALIDDATHREMIDLM
jgi:DNA-directed RNA polymerase specialized sigma24 family protein